MGWVVTWWERDPETANCQVVVNGEEQYAFWPVDSPIPAGWRETGFRGTAEQCGAYVSQVWTDMRPLSVRGDVQAEVTDPTESP
jgi:MbtH protein